MSSQADDDTESFRAAVRDARALQPPARVSVLSRPRPRPTARFRRADNDAVMVESVSWHPCELDLELGDLLSYRRPGVQDSTFRKLRRGQYRIEAEIDLHGLTLADAKRELRDFLSLVRARQLRCVRIVHGKGLRSGPRGPVLKNAVNLILRNSADVVAFCSARQVDGGTGAIYVLFSR